MDVTQQPAINEAPDIAPIELSRKPASVMDRLSLIESVLNIN